MIVNNWFVVISLLAALYNFHYEHSILNAYKVDNGGALKNNRFIREESYNGNSQQVGSETASAKEASKAKRSSSGASLASASNREVVFGSDEITDDDASIINNAVQFKQAQHKQRNENAQADASATSNKVVKKSASQDDADFLESLLLNRKQRIDHAHKSHDTNLKALKNFHKQKQLQAYLLNEKENNFNMDYETMLNRELNKHANSKSNHHSNNFIQNEMNVDEIGKAMFVGGDGIKNNMALKDVLTASENMMSKPVNLVDVKENIFVEKDYNNKHFKQPMAEHKMASGQNQAELFDDINLKLLDAAQPIENNKPSLKQKSSNVVDPGLNAKFELIKQQNDYLFIVVVAGCTLAGVIAIVAAGVCWHTVHKNSKAANNVEYGGTKPASGGLFNRTGSVASSGSGSMKKGGLGSANTTGDRRLAQSAQMYHYQHQKQQMIAMEKANNDTKPDNSDNSEGETEEGDYTVYECPGLAPTGEMEVKNPLFKEEFAGLTPNQASPSMSHISLPPDYSTLPKQNETTTIPPIQPKETTVVAQAELIKLETSNDNTAVQPSSDTKPAAAAPTSSTVTSETPKE